MTNWIKTLFCKHEYIPRYYGICKIGLTCHKCGKDRYEDRSHRPDGKVLLDAIQRITRS